MRLYFVTLLILLFACLTAQEVIITGLVDGTQSGRPRAVELYVSERVDLAEYAIERYANGSAVVTDAGSLSGVYTDAFVYVLRADHEADFTTAFGADGDFANRINADNILGTGDDAFALTRNGTIVDVIGGTIGTSFNTYQDGWLYRNDETGPDGGWVATNWANVGNTDVLDGLSLAEIGAAVPFGTYTAGAGGPNVTVAARANLAEPGTDGGFVLTIDSVSGTPLTVAYSLSGSATLETDYIDPNTGSIIIPAGSASVDLTLEVIDDNASEVSEDIIITLTGTDNPDYAANGTARINLLDDEAAGQLPIHVVQGDGAASPLVGQTVTVAGIVVGDFQGGDGVGLGGFFVQEEDADADDDPTTSEGIFITGVNGSPEVTEGDLVLITGRVTESDGLTTVDVGLTGAAMTVLSAGNLLPTAATLVLPVNSDADLEAVEGMRTTVTGPVTLTSNFGLGRFGEFEVSVGDRLVQYTECNDPDPDGLAAYNAAQDRRRLTVDDGRGGQNNFPVTLPGGTLTPDNSLRAGTVFTGLTGIMDERFAGYRLQFLETAGQTDGVPRPTAAPELGGDLTVVGMNVLNYFTTFGSRGARNQEEFDRQEAKIVAAICELDADIIGLAEIENNGSGPDGALQTLVDAIAAGCGTDYNFVVNPNPGGDEIQVALIYKTATVEESGTPANLAEPSIVFSRSRVPLAQTFRVTAAGSPSFGQEITVVANHWKSKGGSCGASDDDDGGAGSCDGSRTAAARAIRDWLATDPTGTGETDQLVIGDLNAYSQEAPLTTFTDAGWSNTVRANNPAGSFPCGSVPSYVFRGEWGSLDHALASPSLGPKVTGATPWRVNAPEPTALGYSTRFDDPSLYAADFYRFSDHDPVVVALDLSIDLPADILTFGGTERNGEVDLAWTTALEEGVERYDVERRGADGTFAVIGSVAASGSNNDYAFTDTAPNTAANEYRLRLVDDAGQASFSTVVTVVVERPSSLALRQGPEGPWLIGEAGANYRLLDAAGRTLRRGRTRSTLALIDVKGLPAGVYFLTVRERGRKGRTFRVVVR